MLRRRLARAERKVELLEQMIEKRTRELFVAQQAVRERKEMLERLFDAVPTGQLLVDAETHRIADVNRAACELIGASRSEIVGEVCHRFVCPAEEGRCPVTDLGQNVEMSDRVLLTRDGRSIPILKTVAQVQIDGRRHLLEAFFDITERRQAVEAMEAARVAAEESSRAKSEFLANMSHEIRTPMNGVLGMTDLLLDTRLDADQRDLALAAKRSAESLLGIINDILDFSKIEAGRLELEPIEFMLRDALQDIASTFAVRAAEKQLELAVSVAEDVPERVVGDVGRLRQVLVNLLGNAIKFTPAGDVWIEARVEERTDEDVLLHVAVHDTGVGIAADRLESIFEPFTQADASTTRRFGGTGLGLTISAQLVRMMGGRTWVESELGRGSTFHMTARLGIAQKRADEQPTAEPLVLRELPVLIVDDNANNRRILDAMLRSWSLRPETAPGGRDALDRLAKLGPGGSEPQLLLVDAHMPEMDGFTFVETLRSARADRPAPPIIMLTSAGQRGDAARCRELGISAYLTKPVSHSCLLDAIVTVMGARKAPVIEPAPLVTRHSLRESRGLLRVLLAEDNEVNQKLATRLLARRGYSVTVANDGREAVERFRAARAEPFDVVLMDIQMPQMDGFEALAVVRADEAATGAHKVPVIALTAHAMKGDRERCIEAGFDGYVSKPVRADTLFAEIDAVTAAVRAGLERRSLGPNGTGADPAGAAAGALDTGIDPTALLERVDGDRELLADIVELFERDTPSLLVEIADAVTAADAATLSRSAHRLKGMVGNFTLGRPYELVARLEQVGREAEATAEGSAPWGGADGAAGPLYELLTEARAAMDAVTERLRALVSETGS